MRPARRIYVAAALLALVIPLTATIAAAAPTNAKAILARALSDGAHASSVTVSGTLTSGGLTAHVFAQTSGSGYSEIDTVSGIGTEYIVAPAKAHYVFVKGSSLAVLKKYLLVSKPTPAEVGLWYRLTLGDPRYTVIAPENNQTVAQTFSFGTSGWSHSARYEGTTTLWSLSVKKVHVIKLAAASNIFVTGPTGFGPTTLYVTSTARPLPFAVTSPSVHGTIYFSQWNTSKIVIPTSRVALPS
jgi:hypothetical protein